MRFAEIFASHTTTNFVDHLLGDFQLVHENVLIQRSRISDYTRDEISYVVLVGDCSRGLALIVKVVEHSSVGRRRIGLEGEGHMHPDSYIHNGERNLLVFQVVVYFRFLSLA